MFSGTDRAARRSWSERLDWPRGKAAEYPFDDPRG